MKIKYLIAFSLLILFSCSKDEKPTTPEPQSPVIEEPIAEEPNEEEPPIVLAPNGLVMNVPTVVPDTLMVDKNLSIKILSESTTGKGEGGSVLELEISGTKSNLVKKGQTLIDNINDGVYVVADFLDDVGDKKVVKAVRGTINAIFQNAIIKYSSGENQAKTKSSYNKKQEPYYLHVEGFDKKESFLFDKLELAWEDNGLPNFGRILSNEDGRIFIDLAGFVLLKEGESEIKIKEGTVELFTVIDLEAKFSPTKAVLSQFPGLGALPLGAVDETHFAVYTDFVFDVTLEGTLAGEPSINKTLLSYINVIPVGPLFITLDLDVDLELSGKLTNEFEIVPKYRIEKQIVNHFTYTKEGGIQTGSESIKDEESGSMDIPAPNIGAELKFALQPVATARLYNTVGPQAKLDPFISVKYNTKKVEDIWLKDLEMKAGVGYEFSVDMSFLDRIVGVIPPKIDLFEGEVISKTLYAAPNSFKLIGGNNQTGFQNSTLEIPIEIEVIDSNNNGVALIPVYFETENGEFSKEADYTDASGITLTSWKLGSKIGEQKAYAVLRDGKGNQIGEKIEINATATTTGNNSIGAASNPMPENDATNVPLNGSLSFTAGNNTPSNATYRVYTGLDQNPTTFTDSPSPENTYSDLLPNTTYYWRIETISSNGEVLTSSDTWKFTTTSETSTIGAAINPVPVNNSIDQPLDGIFSFTAGANTPPDAIFNLRIQTVGEEEVNINLEQQTSYSYTNLKESSEYLWQIETLDNSGNLLATSPIWRFTTIGETTRTPSNGAIDQQLNGTFSFASQTGVVIGSKFVVSYYNSTDQVEQEIETLIPEANYSNLLPNTEYFWYVKVVSPQGATLAISDTWSFTTTNSTSSQIYNGDLDFRTQEEVNNFGVQKYNIVNGNVFFSDSFNESITDLSSLSSLEEINGNLNIDNLKALETLKGLNNIKSISGDLTLIDNFLISSINGLNNLESVNGNITIYLNASLTSMQGLNNLASVGGYLEISANPKIVTLEGLNNLESVDDALYIGTENSGTGFGYKNELLSNFCALTKLITSDGLQNEYLVENNAFNPTKQDIINGNCKN